MAVSVELWSDPSDFLDKARGFLRVSPLEHNLILTLLHRRIDDGTAGRYWMITDDEKITGVVFQSPLDFAVAVTPMNDGAIRAVVEAVASAGFSLPGVIGDAATAARFAGCWTERTKSAAAPRDGQRIYALGQLELLAPVEGELVKAVGDDVDLIARWAEGFAQEARAVALTRDTIADRVNGGEFWLWRTPAAVSMAAHTPETEGVVRIYGVYTPPEHRQHGYAAACVGQLSSLLRDSGRSCMLYTDLGDPVSNSIYRRLGYEAIGEVIRYEFSSDRIP